MRYFAIILTVILSILFSHQEELNHVDQTLINELNSLAEAEGLEFVYGDRFPIINPYGSYGSTYVYDFLVPGGQNPFSRSVLFLSRKKRDPNTKSSDESVRDLIFDYDYMLVFAVKRTENDSFEVHSTIEEGIGLMGMSLYYGSLDKQLSDFHYLGAPDEAGPQGESLGYRNVSIPVVISSESSTTILVYHYEENRWLKYVERDI